jgi:ABC-2 type transport system ATP-binding protein
MVTLENILFAYHRKMPLFNGFNLHLCSGQVYGLAGKNGTGKTTLLKIMAGMLFPDQGICIVLDDIPKKRKPHFLQKIFFIPEFFLLPQVTINKYIWLYGPYYPDFNTRLFTEILEAFMLNDKQLLSDLSNGDQRKVLLAFALSSGVRLLLLDEPALALDVPARRVFRKYLARFVSEQTCVILSSHQMSEMENLIDELILMEGGQIVIQDSLDHISEKLFFCTEKNIPSGASVLYSEQRVSGKAVICSNKVKKESSVDLELLFNAFINDKQLLKGALK